MYLSERIIDFYCSLDPPSFLPKGVEIMDPYNHSETRNIVESFYSKFYRDNNPRVILMGINPGRFGGGITGIPFTDPVNLEEICGIENRFDKRHELSSKFIYEMIDALGGVEKFYSGIYISAVSPLGFISKGKNLNYYDISELAEKWKPFMVKSLKEQIEFCGHTEVCFSLGRGKNLKFLKHLNEEYKLFDRIEPLPHPRWVMQYRLKTKNTFIKMYENALQDYL